MQMRGSTGLYAKPCVLLALTLLNPGVAQAASDPIYCHGKITEAMVTAGSELLVVPSFRNDWVQICNIKTEWKGIAADICKNWSAQATTAVAGRLDVTFHYFVDNGVTCGSIPTYSNGLNLQYFVVRTPTN